MSKAKILPNLLGDKIKGNWTTSNTVINMIKEHFESEKIA